MGKIEMMVVPLGDDNYGTWCPRMEMLLTVEGLMAIVREGVDEDATAADIEKDAKSRAMIGSHLSDQYLSLYKESASAKALWDALQTLFIQKNMSRRLTLRRELTSLKKSPAESVSKYIARAKKLCDDLAGVEQNISEDEVVLCVLAGLPRQYEVCIQVMDQQDRALTLDDCLRYLLNVEHKLLSSHEDEPVAFHVRSGYKGSRPGRGGGAFRAGIDNRVCHYCQQTGHILPNCHVRRADLQKRGETRAAMVSFADAY
jgi:hypothetical protein